MNGYILNNSFNIIIIHIYKMYISNLQIGIIMFIIIMLFIVIFQSIGNDIILYRMNFFRSLYKNYYIDMNKLFEVDNYKNFKIYHKIIDSDKPFIFYFSPMVNPKRLEKIFESDCNIVQIQYKKLVLRPSTQKKKYIEAFDYFTSKYNISNNIHVFGVCSFTDLSCYIVHKRPDKIKSLILDSPMYNYRKTIKNIRSIHWINMFFKDDYTLYKKYNIPVDVLLIQFEGETICTIEDSIEKSKKLKNNNNNVYLYIVKTLKTEITENTKHALSYHYEEYPKIINQWLYS